MTGRIFDIPAGGRLKSAGVWPTGSQRRSDTLGGNHDFGDLGRTSWREVRAMIDEERATLARLAERENVASAYDAWQRTGEPSFDGDGLGRRDRRPA